MYKNEEDYVNEKWELLKASLPPQYAGNVPYYNRWPLIQACNELRPNQIERVNSNLIQLRNLVYIAFIKFVKTNNFQILLYIMEYKSYTAIDCFI